jgi:diguanylate cyclase (GGDEF)-like protein
MGICWNVENYRYLLNESEANIFNLLLRQMILAVDKINNLNEIRHINVALKESSLTDYLTGLKNRNGFYDSVTKIMSEANESGRVLDIAVLYIDLDNFKYYNDTFGHDVGDLVLKEVANILTESASDRGFAVRYGGDEFLIVLIDSGKEEAMAIAKMTLDVLLGKNGYVNEISSFLGRRVVVKTEKKLSCSIGVSNSDNVKNNDDLTELLKYADSSLYDIKNSTKCAVKYYEKEER